MTFTDASTSAKALDYPDMPGSSTGTFGDCLADYSPKDKPWDVHKAQSDRIACIYASDSEFKSLGARVWACAGELLFAWVDLPFRRFVSGQPAFVECAIVRFASGGVP
jgi:hypothetical protein